VVTGALPTHRPDGPVLTYRTTSARTGIRFAFPDTGALALSNTRIPFPDLRDTGHGRPRRCRSVVDRLDNVGVFGFGACARAVALQWATRPEEGIQHDDGAHRAFR
jgi:hypothetical protein